MTLHLPRPPGRTEGEIRDLDKQTATPNFAAVVSRSRLFGRRRGGALRSFACPTVFCNDWIFLGFTEREGRHRPPWYSQALLRRGGRPYWIGFVPVVSDGGGDIDHLRAVDPGDQDIGAIPPVSSGGPTVDYSMEGKPSAVRGP